MVGAGATGARAARQLASTKGIERLVVHDTDRRQATQVAESIGAPAEAEPGPPGDRLRSDCDVVVLCCPGDHRALAERALEVGAQVVSVTDDVPTVRGLLELGPEATERNLSVVVGAGFAPGLSCLLARHAAADFDEVNEVHVAKSGTAGAACARQHHRALRGRSVDWRDQAWTGGQGGSGRELVWFPDPIGGEDCYRAALPDALLLVPAFADARRITSRVSASRRDRLTGRLPMLRPPHAEGLIGAVRVEVRGRRNSLHDTKVLGAVDRPGVAAGTVAAVAAVWAAEGRLARAGAGGLAALVAEPAAFLHDLAERGVRAAVFEGG